MFQPTSKLGTGPVSALHVSPGNPSLHVDGSGYANSDLNIFGQSLWYPDSGATHHMASDISSFSDFSSYSGSDQVMVGNGSGLSISNIGSFPLSNQLVLRKVLHVPGLVKNLLSISQLTRDNDCVVIFTAQHFIVKDWRTGIILLQGPHKDVLYEFSPQQNPCAPKCLLGSRVSAATWHRRFEHPTYPVLRQLLSSHEVQISKVPFCEACQLGKAHRLPFSPSTF